MTTLTKIYDEWNPSFLKIKNYYAEKHNLAPEEAYENPKIWKLWVSSQRRIEGRADEIVRRRNAKTKEVRRKEAPGRITEIEENLYCLAKSLPCLPHDRKWYLASVKKRKGENKRRLFASGCYEATNEEGSYCHVYGFTLTLEPNLPNLLSETPNLLFETHETRETQGSKLSKKFQITRLNFHGQKENSCCGYELKDYLRKILQEALDYAYENGRAKTLSPKSQAKELRKLETQKDRNQKAGEPDTRKLENEIFHALFAGAERKKRKCKEVRRNEIESQKRREKETLGL